MTYKNSIKVFDAHFHIIEPQFPLVSNNGYLPDFFPITEYRKRTDRYNLVGGAIVSGSFQSVDQTYLVHALKVLGDGFIGVTQLRETATDEELIDLDKSGIKGVRFNLRRGGSENAEKIKSFGQRIYDLVGWHTELYVDSRELSPIIPLLENLPAVSIGHLGLSAAGLPNILKLVKRGVRIKATGFGRVDFDVANAMQDICSIDDNCLIFGTDLPSTRVDQPYSHRDFELIVNALGIETAKKVFYDNAMNFYFNK
ncbi:MAG: amidohydrolase family protein [Proteobacteria bacterium]|nr:amidohydrolase family protein [Pseudomonadota bacterium]